MWILSAVKSDDEGRDVREKKNKHKKKKSRKRSPTVKSASESPEPKKKSKKVCGPDVYLFIIYNELKMIQSGSFYTVDYFKLYY